MRDAMPEDGQERDAASQPMNTTGETPGPPIQMTVETAATPDRRAAIPNVLTLARLAMTVLVIAGLTLYDHPAGPRWSLPLSAGLFILAALTDTLDGYLARKWNVVSVFGRVMDPFADKVLVLGSFIVLAGPGFADLAGHTVSGVTPWMVVILLARELLVTSIRGVMEGAGVSFAANTAGKLKMVLQSFAVPAILVLLWLGPKDPLGDPRPPVRIAIGVIAWLTLLVTIVSAKPSIAAMLRTGLSTEPNRP